MEFFILDIAMTMIGGMIIAPFLLINKLSEHKDRLEWEQRSRELDKARELRRMERARKKAEDARALEEWESDVLEDDAQPTVNEYIDPSEWIRRNIGWLENKVSQGNDFQIGASMLKNVNRDATARLVHQAFLGRVASVTTGYENIVVNISDLSREGYDEGREDVIEGEWA